MAALPTPPAIDYTSRDYSSIRDDLIALIPYFMPEWTSRSPSDFGIVFLEMFAYVGDILNYYADRNAAEAFLDTAALRSSVIRLARMLGYSPALALAAQTQVTFTNSTASPVVIPALTKVGTTLNNVTDTPVTFETATTITVSANASATVTANEGVTTTSEQLGVSDGSIFQTYPLFNPNVIQGSVAVTVTSGLGQVWNYTPFLVTAGPYDQSYSLLLDENNVTSVTFGDGANGLIPPVGATITATYRVGGGAAGNVAAGALTRIIDNLPAGLTVNNAAAASGGANTESTDSIRANAMRAVNSQNRCITLDDYANMALTVPGISKASAVSSVIGSCTVYVAPDGGGGVDGSGNPLTGLQSLMSTVQTTLNNAKPAPTTVTVLGPTYVPTNITVNVHVLNNFRQDRTINDATQALNDLLNFDNVIFNDNVTVADIQQAMLIVQGAAWTDVTVLDRGTGTGLSNSVQFAVNEIPVVGTITVNATGGIF